MALVTEGADIIGTLITEIGQIGLWIKAVGLIFILWVIFQIIALIVNRKKRKALYKISSDLERIESKIDKLLKNKKV
ncbi:hypothetical protein J4408_03970 [Candidatus Pacearchaeota archaeon]|nr:hypothetical protein [Candidatus Pacearchaeota archaeon]